MRKFTLILASLFITIGAMAQTFVQPVTGRFYKIKGLHSTHPWLGAVVEGGGIDVLATEAEAGIYLKTERGLKAVTNNKYMGTGGNGSQISLVDAEADVTLESAGNNMYYIKTGGRYLHNNQADYTREGGRDVTSQNKFGFVEVGNPDAVLADGVYTIQADENGKRGYLAISSNENHGTRPVLTEISWSDYSGNSCTTIVENSKYWYVKTIDGVTYLSNIGNGKFIYDNGTDDIHYRSLPYGLNVAEHNNYIHVGSGTGTRFLSMGCGTIAPNQVKWEKLSPNDGGCLLTFTPVENGTTNFATQIAKADFMITSAPKAGNYYRIKAVAGRNDDAPYLSSENYTNSSRAAFTADNGANSIFYFNGSHLLSYASGNYLVNRSNFLGYNGVQTAGTNIDFNASSVAGAFNIIFIGNNNGLRSLYCRTENYTDAGGGIVDDTGYRFNIEAVETLPVTISAAKYATFYAPVAVEVAEDVTAYTVSINEGGWADLNEIEGGVIPANTGVVLYSETAGTYNFAITEDVEAIDGNALRGSAATTYYTTAGTYYALARVAGEVGFYKDAFNNSRFQNNSHKAYLYIANQSNVSFFGFRGEGTTGVEEVEIRNEKEEIFDLSGRRVNEITATGIYVVGGRKVLVK